MNHTQTTATETKKRLPKGYFAALRPQMEEDAKTMSNTEMAEKYNTTRAGISVQLTKMGIKRPTEDINWSSRKAEFLELAAKTYPRAIAEHFGTTISKVYATMKRFGIHAVRTPKAFALDDKKAELEQMAKDMTQTEIAKKLDVHPRTVKKFIGRKGIECKPGRQKISVWDSARKEEVLKMQADGMTPATIADHFGVAEPHLRKRMRMLGSPLDSAKPAPKAPKPVLVKKSRLPALPPSRPGRIPGSAVRVPKPKPDPAQIIMPENVKMTISHFNPPPNTRICNGSSYERYDPKARTVGARWGY